MRRIGSRGIHHGRMRRVGSWGVHHGHVRGVGSWGVHHDHVRGVGPGHRVHQGRHVRRAGSGTESMRVACGGLDPGTESIRATCGGLVGIRGSPSGPHAGSWSASRGVHQGHMRRAGSGTGSPSGPHAAGWIPGTESIRVAWGGLVGTGESITGRMCGGLDPGYRVHQRKSKNWLLLRSRRPKRLD